MQWLGHPHDMLRALRLCTDLRDVICRRSIEAGKRPSKHLDLVALGACIHAAVARTWLNRSIVATLLTRGPFGAVLDRFPYT